MHIFGKLYGYVWGSAFRDTSNTYIIKDDTTVIIDPGCYKSFTNLFGLMKNDKIDVQDVDLIINTHLHKDHCESNPMFMRRGALLTFHELEKDFTAYNYKADLKLDDFNTGSIDVEIIHTPGHTPGSIVVHLPEYEAIICGDLIFENGLPGRTDIYGGDKKKMVKSIEKVKSYEPKYIMPGHGRIVEGKKGISALFDKALQILSRY